MACRLSLAASLVTIFATATPLCAHAQSGTTPVKAMLAQPGTVAESNPSNPNNANGATQRQLDAALINTARSGDFDKFMALVARGATLRPGAMPASPPLLTIAAVGGNADIVRHLLVAGVDPLQTFSIDGAQSGLQAIHAAANADVARLLLAAGAKADATTFDGYQPLHWAVRNPQLVQLRSWQTRAPLTRTRS